MGCTKILEPLLGLLFIRRVSTRSVLVHLSQMLVALWMTTFVKNNKEKIFFDSRNTFDLDSGLPLLCCGLHPQAQLSSTERHLAHPGYSSAQCPIRNTVCMQAFQLGLRKANPAKANEPQPVHATGMELAWNCLCTKEQAPATQAAQL